MLDRYRSVSKPKTNGVSKTNLKQLASVQLQKPRGVVKNLQFLHQLP